MHWPTNRRSTSRLVMIVLGGAASAALAGCSTSADVSYGTYQFGPGYQSGQTYESRVYGDTSQGIGAENCRSVMRRHADAYGRVSSTQETVCD